MRRVVLCQPHQIPLLDGHLFDSGKEVKLVVFSDHFELLELAAALLENQSTCVEGADIIRWITAHSESADLIIQLPAQFYASNNTKPNPVLAAEFQRLYFRIWKRASLHHRFHVIFSDSLDVNSDVNCGDCEAA
eukprot:Gregarina_sp_Poly_1__5363@NODE_2831_length_1656_cov_1068_096916_g1785_i0_p3_GENE_NODE_2831_length_1656_cov_1068_096916_g1785_i0NODE_2831_length_1656_cov_1068_096916_g1785_i0_p3_ORF_typecomplete_len134_score15_39_NODE_2831_length_1656_cov_1068_096916_g1785_i04405